MADSKYYKKQYDKKKSEVKKYEGDIDDLKTVRDRINDNYSDDVRNVNKEIDALIEDLKDSVRYVTTFTNNANNLQTRKEKSVGSDSKLKTALSELNEEINRLSTLKREAAEDRDYYWRMYKKKKEEEQQEFWDSLLGKG